MPAAALTMIVTARGHEPAAAALLVQPGSVTERDFALAGSGALSGTVRSAGDGGTPVAGARVTISDLAGHVVPSAVTSGNGEFSVAGAPTGRYALTATAAGHLPASQEVELNGHAERAQLTLPLEREVYGFVRAPGGAAVPGILVTAASATGEIVASATTDADGWYRLAGLGDGEHVLVAGGHEPVRTSVDVHGGETTSVTVRVGSSPAAPAAQQAPAAQPAGAQATAQGAEVTENTAGWADSGGQYHNSERARAGNEPNESA
jgi:Carboxypeptidase regulatory-like domain